MEEKEHLLKSRRNAEEEIQQHSTTNSFQLIAAISTVVVIVTFPLGTNAAAIHAGKLAWLASGPIIRDTMFIVSKIPASLWRTMTLGSVGS